MHLDEDAVLEAVDALDDTLRAARAALESLAARALPFAAQARVHRQSTRHARAWVREHIDLTPLPAAPQAWPARDDGTDEILRRTLDDDGRTLDDGPEGAADDNPPLTEETGEAPLDALVSFTDDGAGLVAFDDDDDDNDDDGEILEAGADDEGDDVADLDDEDDEVLAGLEADDDEVSGMVDDDLGGLISFDEDDDEVLDLGDDDASGVIDEAFSDDDLVDADDLVSFEDGDADLVTLSPDGADLGEASEDDGDDATPAGAQALAEEPAPKDATLVTDLESLVRLQDLLEEDDAAGALTEGERPQTPRGADPRLASNDRLRVTTTLTDEDLGKLGFSSREDLVSPEGSDADPNSETGSRPRIQLDTPDDPVREASASPEPTSRRPTGGASVSIPTIRDAGPSQSRPTAAAIRIDPEGGGQVVEEQEVLALGEADDDDPSVGGGFTLDVEEYELEEIEEIDEEVPVEPEPAPAPMPELSDDQEQVLLRRADAALEAGKLQEAAELYSDVLDFNPDNADAALGRGRAYLDLADYARAMSDFTVAEDLRPDDPDTNAAIGELYYARKDYARAIEYFDQALEADPKHAMAWCRRGIAHYYRKDYDQAYDDLVKAQKLDDAIPNIRTYIGMVKKKRR